MIDVIIGLVCVIILALAGGYVVRAKKRGDKCIGCSACSGGCSGCAGSCHHE